MSDINKYLLLSWPGIMALNIVILYYIYKYINLYIYI